MTHLSPLHAQRRMASNSSLMKTPDYLEALVHKKITPMSEKIKKAIELKEQAQNRLDELQKQRQNLDAELAKLNLRVHDLQVETVRKRREYEAECIKQKKIDKRFNSLRAYYDDSEKVTEAIVKTYRADDVLNEFCFQADVDIKMLLSKSRQQDVCRNRHMLAWILYRNSKASAPQIAKMLNRLDHTTILHSMKRVEQNSELREDAARLEGEIILALDRREAEK